MKFAKLCCGGNDFIVIEGSAALSDENLAALATRLCARRTGVGADGLIVTSPHKEHPFQIQLVNADGSRAEVSFNGSRCVGRFACEEGNTSDEFSFASDAGPIRVKVEGRVVTLWVPPPAEIRRNLKLDERGERVDGHAIRVGVPYFVIFQDDLNYSWIGRVPPRLRTHPEFPRGTNVAVACRRDSSTYEARFFERGVAEETLSSGSGCVAVATVAALVHNASPPVLIKTKGGDFGVEFQLDDRNFREISTSGEVNYIYRGELTPEMINLPELN